MKRRGTKVFGAAGNGDFALFIAGSRGAALAECGGGRAFAGARGGAPISSAEGTDEAFGFQRGDGSVAHSRGDLAVPLGADVSHGEHAGRRSSCPHRCGYSPFHIDEPFKESGIRFLAYEAEHAVHSFSEAAPRCCIPERGAAASVRQRVQRGDGGVRLP